MSKETQSYERNLSASQLKKINYLLSYKIYNKEISKKNFRQSLEAKITQRYTKTRGSFRRKEMCGPDLENNILAVTDIDDDYYRYVNGRLLNIFKPEFKSMKSLLSKRLHIEYEKYIRKDCILNIDTNCRNEAECYNMSVTNLADQAKHFDSFILQDYEKSKFLLSRCANFSAKVERKIKELQKVANDLFNVKSKLIGLDYKYSVQQKYGRFLYYLSPPSWRANNREFAHSMEIEAKGFDLGKLNEEDTFSAIFDKLGGVCFGTPIEPVLYFREPSDLIAVFNGMEKQQLYYFTHVNHLEPYTKLLNDNIRVLRNQISQDYSLVDQLIKSFKDLLEFTEKSSAQLEKKFFRVLYGQFYKSTGTKDILKFQINLEYCYEKVFLDKPGNTDIVFVSKALERYFLDYSKRLDAFQSKSVRRAMAQYAAGERLKYKNAESATKELRLFRRLEDRLLRAFGFMPLNKNVPVSQPLCNRRNKISKNNCKIKKNDTLNSAELEYLHLFTEWCENENPEEYLRGLSLSDQ